MWRLAGLLAVLIALLLAASAAANAGRYGLRCVDGRIEARRGTVLPGRMQPLEDPLFVPLAVPAQLCRDSDHGSRRALERAYVETAMASVDAAIAAGSSEDLHRSLASLELLLGAAGDHVDTSGLERRRQALLLARLRVEVEQARNARQRARDRLEQARDAGIDDPVVDELARELEAPAMQAPRESGEDPEVPAAEFVESDERAL